MTKEEQHITYVQAALGVCGRRSSAKELDLIISLSNLIISKGGNADLHDIIKIELEVMQRHIEPTA